MKRVLLVTFAVLVFGLSGWTANETTAPADAPATPPATEPPASMEKALTPEGARVIWRRTPATEADLTMPIFSKGLVLDSFVYRVRDRRRNDLINFARVLISTTESTQGLLDFYQKALGPTVQRSTKKQTGETFLTVGTQDNFRLVIITPQAGYTHLRLEHVQRFIAPPRVYTAQEQRVLRVLGEIGQTYSSARRVAYRNHERTFYSDDTAEDNRPELVVAIDFIRPSQISLTVTQGEITPLTIVTKDGNLEFMRPGKEVQRRAIAEAITLHDLPELRDDPIARLMLNETLITPDVDYLALIPVKDIPTNRQIQVVLTYPDYRATQYLLLDLQKKMLLRSEIVVKEDDYQMHIERVFTDQIIEQPPVEPAVPVPATPAATPAPAAVTGT
ncbi:MAG: hypothetical protein ACYC7E_18970 [Armatimonadota bacterium]